MNTETSSIDEARLMAFKWLLLSWGPLWGSAQERRRQRARTQRLLENMEFSPKYRARAEGFLAQLRRRKKGDWGGTADKRRMRRIRKTLTAGGGPDPLLYSVG